MNMGIWAQCHCRRSARGMVVLGLSLVFAHLQGVASAAECIDSDGDGWGWDGESSCLMGAASETIENTLDGAANCIDSDGDGWGWDGQASCRLDEQTAADPITPASCVDSDGDGWGWDGENSCRPGTDIGGPDNPAETACIDPDGDGWGWDGQASCRVGDDPHNAIALALTRVQADVAIREALKNSVNTTGMPLPNAEFADGDSAENSEARVEESFSSTNVQETGVDEYDRIKVDGSILFTLSDNSNSFPLAVFDETANAADASFVAPQQVGSRVNAWHLDGENTQLLSRTEVFANANEADGLYLHNSAAKGRQLIVLSNSGFSPWQAWSSAPYFWSGQSTEVSWLNARNAEDISRETLMEFDGSLISSRKLGSKLVLVTRFYPQVSDLYVYDENTAQYQADDARIEATSAEVLLPNYTVTRDTGSITQPLIADNSCHQSADLDNPAQATVISIITIDLDAAVAQPAVNCFIGETDTLYMSTEALYLAATRYDYAFQDSLRETPDGEQPDAVNLPTVTTQLHKFSLHSNRADYRGSGTVPGHLGWQSDRKPFRLSEWNGDLRVLTFGDESSISPVQLTILREGSGATLQTISTLPNASQPDLIGKPGERLYASRFMGERAYLVTFQVIDPLYILDLSDPQNPFIAGELELPGFSDYLHLVGNNLLLGVGKDAVPAQDATAFWPGGDGRGAWFQGVKLALFDISNAASPTLVDSIVYGKRGTNTPVLYQHHSLAALPGNANRNARFAMPLALHDEPLQGNHPSAWSDWSENQLIKFEVDETTQSIVTAPPWQLETNAANDAYATDLYNDRSLIGSDDSVYLLHSNRIHYGTWDSVEPATIVSE